MNGDRKRWSGTRSGRPRTERRRAQRRLRASSAAARRRWWLDWRGARGAAGGQCVEAGEERRGNLGVVVRRVGVDAAGGEAFGGAGFVVGVVWYGIPSPRRRYSGLCCAAWLAPLR